jgi:hypothetical protein
MKRLAGSALVAMTLSSLLAQDSSQAVIVQAWLPSEADGLG